MIAMMQHVFTQIWFVMESVIVGLDGMKNRA